MPFISVFVRLQRFGTSLYTLNRVDAKAFRNVAFDWITSLKKHGQLRGDEVVVRRSALDECRGDRWVLLIRDLRNEGLNFWSLFTDSKE